MFSLQKKNRCRDGYLNISLELSVTVIFFTLFTSILNEIYKKFDHVHLLLTRSCSANLFVLEFSGKYLDTNILKKISGIVLLTQTSFSISPLSFVLNET